VQNTASRALHRNPKHAIRDGVPGEVKHLSSQRKIKQSAQAHNFLSSGERKGRSLNLSFVSLLIIGEGYRDNRL